MQYPGYHGQQPYQQPPPKPPTWPVWLAVLLGVGIVGLRALILIGRAPGATSRSEHTAGPSQAKQSSPFARADVRCSRLGASVSCSVTMSRGHGVACWETIAVCDGLERTATRCSDPLENGETASYSIEGEEFTPPLTWDMRCSSFRVGKTLLK